VHVKLGDLEPAGVDRGGLGAGERIALGRVAFVFVEGRDIGAEVQSRGLVQGLDLPVVGRLADQGAVVDADVVAAVAALGLGDAIRW
jgi:hypothetical protein